MDGLIEVDCVECNECGDEVAEPFAVPVVASEDAELVGAFCAPVKYWLCDGCAAFLVED